jgi:hypothetical protein
VFELLETLRELEKSRVHPLLLDFEEFADFSNSLPVDRRSPLGHQRTLENACA